MEKYTWTLSDYNLRNHFGISLDFNTASYPYKHNHTFYELTMVVDGSIIHHYNNIHEILHSGDLILLKPAFTHYFEAIPDSNDRFLCINIGVNEKIFKSIVESINIPLIKNFIDDSLLHLKFKLNDQYRKQVFEKALYLRDFENKKTYNYSLKLKFLLINVLEAITGSSSIGESTMPSWLTKFLDDLNNPEVYQLKLNELYKFSNYSRNYLCPLFKKHMGVTLQSYITAKKMDYAAYLLKFTNKRVSEIASMVGFSIQGHFSVLFRQTYKCTPSEYRAKWHSLSQVEKTSQ